MEQLRILSPVLFGAAISVCRGPLTTCNVWVLGWTCLDIGSSVAEITVSCIASCRFVDLSSLIELLICPTIW